MMRDTASMKAARRESYQQQAYGRRGVSPTRETERRIEALIRLVDDALTSQVIPQNPAGTQAATRDMLREAEAARRWAREMGQAARRGA